ncbi:MAG: nodulation protein NfeD [Cyclobacteriaceae bacterium]|nr:nodulation protein NfeD [Cyclobacteriaceae bacterium]
MNSKVVLIVLLSFSAFNLGIAQTTEKAKVYLLEIKSEIDPRMNRYIDLAFEEASNQEVDYVIIEMNTYGGAVNDANDIVETILNYEKPVFVFIDKNAASAGALISIACDSIYMTQGSSIGAATVVIGDGTAAPDKYQSYMRSKMRATAEAKGRDPKIAEAMVDQNIQLDSISDLGQVITFSTSEAIKYGFCEAEVKSIEEVLMLNNIEQYEIIKHEVSTAEKIISLVLNPFVSGILIMIIVGGIYFELQTPGVGFPILAAFIAITLYFVPHYLNGLAENWEMVAFFIGILLIALEIFVIPGFGIAGVAGIIVTFGSLVLIMVNNDAFDFTFVDKNSIMKALITTSLGLVGSFLLMFFGGVRFASSKTFQRLALLDTQNRDEGYTSRFNNIEMTNKEGVAFTILRPSGKVIIDNETYDAYSRGEYIEKGEKIIVISEEGTSLKVKKLN